MINAAYMSLSKQRETPGEKRDLENKERNGKKEGRRGGGHRHNGRGKHGRKKGDIRGKERES